MTLKDKEWERAIERYLIDQGWDTWRALQVKVKRGPMWLNLRADLWECIDIAAMKPDGFLFVQATTTKGVNERRRKIESHRWPVDKTMDHASLHYRVQIWESRAFRDPVDRRTWKYGARIHDFKPMFASWEVLPTFTAISAPSTRSRKRGTGP